MAGEDPLDPPHGGLAERRAAGALRAVSQGRRAQGQAVRRAGVRPRRRRRSVPRHPGGRAGGGGREAARGREHAAPARDASDVHEGGRGASGRRRRGGHRRQHPARELREDGEPRGHLRLHAGRHEPLPRGVRPGGVPLGRGLSEGRGRAALHVVDRRGGRLPEPGRRPHRAAAARHAIRTPSAPTTRRGARCWPRISSRSIA